MPNKNYRRGAEKERRIRKKLLAEGWDLVIRSAGSKSPIDLIAINEKQRRILFIQSKPKSMGFKARYKLLQELKWLDGDWASSVEIR